MQDQAHGYHARRSLNRTRARRVAASVLVGLPLVAALHACVEAPPKIPSIPLSGLSVRVYVFGASATDARHAFDAVRQNNPSFGVVNTGGDGEILVGLENVSPKCVAPTALCEFKVSYRIRDNTGEIVGAETTTINATSERCSDLCSKALNNVATKIVETAAGLLKRGALDDASVDSVEGGVVGAGSSPPDSGAAVDATALDAGTRGAKKSGAKPDVHAKPPPALCAVGPGPRLAADEAERRAAQVEALKRLNVIDQDEYDCLRKEYLARL